MKVAVWSPLPPSPSGIADYVAETLVDLTRLCDVEVVCPEPAAVDPHWRSLVRVCRPGEEHGGLDVYHVGNSPSHAYVYRAALARPGVVVLHDWNLHYLLLGETVEKGDATAYVHEMRRAHGDVGAAMARHVAAALGGEMLPALFPLNDRVLEASLGIVALSRLTAEAVARRLPGRPVLHLPHHVALPLQPLPTRREARRALGLPEEDLILTAPGLATPGKRLDVLARAVARLRGRFPRLRLVIAGAIDPRLPDVSWLRTGVGDATTVTGHLPLPSFIAHLVAADVLAVLRFPSFGEMSGALVRAMGVGRPVLVTAGSPAAEEMPPGTVVPVDPGPEEEGEVTALLARLLEDPDLREDIGALARDHVLATHDLRSTVHALHRFLAGVVSQREALLADIEDDRAEPGTLLGRLKEEVRWASRDLGLPAVPLGLDKLLTELVGETT